MKKISLILSIVLLITTIVYSKEKDKMDYIVSSAGNGNKTEGSADIFTGKVMVEPVYPINSPSANSGAYVTFEKGARSAWHTHPAGQTLVVTSGVAWTGVWNGKSYEAKVGDVIYCPPTIKHWHGASPDYPMTHLSIVETVDGKNVVWLEKVSDKQYTDAGKVITEERRLAEVKYNFEKTLTTREIAFVKISAFSTVADIPKLKIAFNDALTSGITINDINEALIQLYAYTGFPRSLNSIIAFMEVVESRAKSGMKDKVGGEPKVLERSIDKDKVGEDIRRELSGGPTVAGWQKFAPGIELFLKEHLFADIFSRGLLTFQEREIVTVSALACIEGASSQLGSHINMSMNIGIPEKKLEAILSLLAVSVGKKISDNGNAVLKTVLESKAKK